MEPKGPTGADGDQVAIDGPGGPLTAGNHLQSDGTMCCTRTVLYTYMINPVCLFSCDLGMEE